MFINMPGEKSGYTPELKLERAHPLIQQYLSAHPNLSIREQEFLINYYKRLKTKMTRRSAEVFREESRRVKKEGYSGEAFRQVWGAKTQNPESGPNATKLFMNEARDIQETAAKQAIELFEMKRVAEIDRLTGLYRGEAFERYAEQTLQVSQVLAREANKGKPPEQRIVSAYVAFDVDNFKTVNDTIGHESADKQVLEVMGRIIKGAPDQPGIIRSADLASRIGGDEFVILFTYVRSDALQSLVERLLKAFNAITYRTKEGAEQPITVSAGVKVIEADENITLKQARHLADEAGNLAKIEKGSFLIYTPDLPEKIERMILENKDKPDEENKGLQFYKKQQRQLNKRAIETIAEHNPTDLPGYEASLDSQARINLRTKLKQIQERRKSA